MLKLSAIKSFSQLGEDIKKPHPSVPSTLKREGL